SLELVQHWLTTGWNRNPLASNRSTIFQPSGTDLSIGYSEPAGDLANEELGAEVDFFNPEEQMLAGSARFLCRNLFDIEIGQFDFEATTDAGEGQRKIRRQRNLISQLSPRNHRS